MEEGALRVDANVSVHRPGEPYGSRTELKNLNSFKSLGRGIETEIERQIDVLASGNRVQAETRAYDQKTRRTFAMRDKESVADYRFMPEPNLPPLRIVQGDKSEFGPLNCVSIDDCRPSIESLPDECRKQLIDNCGLSLEYTFRCVFSCIFFVAELIFNSCRC
jgi:aspartyl-tRNA(Asn)/glutamyl-tRNA(Gln) amidotransferase subunit B